MKPYPALLLTFAALAAAASLAAADFEGKVRLKMSAADGKAQELDYSVKPGFIRTDIEAAPGQKASMIMDFAKQEMIMLMPAQKMYMVHSIARMTEAANDAAGDDFTFEKTGDKEEILGYDCVKYISKTKDMTSDIWVTEELGRFGGLGNSNNPMGGRSATPNAAWTKALAGKNFFPLRVVSRDPKGREQFRLEAVAVEKGAQPASLFTAPADFQKLDLGGMMKGLGLPGKR